MRHIDNPSSANILPGDCIVATPSQRAALSIGTDDAGKVIVEKSTGRMYLATMTEGAKPLSDNLAAELAAIDDTGLLFVETMVGFGRSGFGTPSGLTNYPTQYAGTYEITGFVVSGARGATTLSIISGTVADLGGEWAGAILHNDGQWRTYTVRNASGATLDVFPPLEAAASNALLKNVHDAANGQHLTEPGYYALADHIANSNALFATRDQYYDRISDAATSGWSLYGGLSAGRLVHNQATNVHSSAGTGLKSAQLISRRTVCTRCACNTNQGVTKTFNIAGLSGYLETFVSCNDPVVPAVVEVYIDAVLVFRESVFSIRNIRVPFTGGSSLECRIYSEALQTTFTFIGSTTIWKTPEGAHPAAIKPGAKVVWLGDSWTFRAGSAVIRRLQERYSEAGVIFYQIGRAGEQATWAIDNFALVAAAKPTVVMIEYFVNDRNALGVGAFETWKSRITTLTDMVQAIGAKAIVIMPCPTGSQTQAQDLANWSAQLAEGTQV